VGKIRIRYIKVKRRIPGSIMHLRLKDTHTAAHRHSREREKKKIFRKIDIKQSRIERGT